MSRLQPIPVDEMSEEMRREWAILTAWRAPKDGLVGGPYDAWLRSPELLHHLQGLGRFFWERTSLDRGLVEYVIALASRHWRCNVEWLYHRERALEHGIAASTLDRLLDGHPPPREERELRLAHATASALLSGRAPGERLYADGRAAFGERGMVEISGIVGYYSLVAFTLQMFDIDHEGGPFAPPSGSDG